MQNAFVRRGVVSGVQVGRCQRATRYPITPTANRTPKAMTRIPAS